MKSIAVVPGSREVQLIDEPSPKITSPTQVKLHMLEVGVCGTDKEICAMQYGTPPGGSAHLVIGHESLGQVVEIGSAVKRLKVGDLVVPTVRRPCPHDHCPACRTGRQDFCFTGDFTERGIKEAHGYMTEFVVDDERYMNLIPGELREAAVLVEPLTIAEKALIQVQDLQMRLPWACPAEGHGCHKAVVLGAGPVGLLGAMALRARGFDTYVYSRSPAPNDRSAIVESFGGRYVPAETTSVEQLGEIVGNIDLVYEATGASKTAFDVMTVLGTNGIYIFTGVPGRKAPVDVDTDLIMRNLVLKNQVVLGTVNAGVDAFEAAVKDVGVFATEWPEAVQALITGRYPPEAYRDLLLGRTPGIKNVITF